MSDPIVAAVMACMSDVANGLDGHQGPKASAVRMRVAGPALGFRRIGDRRIVRLSSYSSIVAGPRDERAPRI